MDGFVPYLKENYKALSGSFFLALLLWIAVTSDKEYTHTIEVPLKIETLGPNLVLKKLPPEKIRLKITGTGRALFALNFADTHIGLEFPEINSDQIINLNDYINKFQFPQDLGIKVVDIITPKRLNLDVDKFYQAEIPVNIVSNIRTLPGYLLADIIPSQDSILVSGPKSLVLEMQKVSTDTIRELDVQYPFEQNANLISPEPGVISIEPQKVNVKFIVEQIVERTIYNIPILITDLPDDIHAEAIPTSISVRVKGGESLISRLTQDDIKVTFNYRDQFESGKMHYPMQIKTPPKITWIDASPTTFNLKLQRRGE
ncbi:MAG: hypothetical protein H6627_11470 [Calditrichae bacterium]|nr:hypothetical protein [Calditrichota bacterium]MCB9059177.1 hypothetical protein [Calditrichia bacterium]